MIVLIFNTILSQPVNYLFEPEDQPNFPDNCPFSDSKNPQKVLSRIQLNPLEYFNIEEIKNIQL